MTQTTNATEATPAPRSSRRRRATRRLSIVAAGLIALDLVGGAAVYLVAGPEGFRQQQAPATSSSDAAPLTMEQYGAKLSERCGAESEQSYRDMLQAGSSTPQAAYNATLTACLAVAGA